MAKSADEEERGSRDNRINDTEMQAVDLEQNSARPGKTTIEVREKKGLLRSAIPRVSVPAAWLVLFFNVFVPGTGTLILALIALCGVKTDMKKQNRCLAFLVNVCTALLQTMTAAIIIGWIWSVYWGMYAVTEANERSQEAKNKKRSMDALNAEEKERLKEDEKESKEEAEESPPDYQN